MERRQEALDRFEKAVELPLLILALAMIPLLVLPLLVALPSGVEATFIAADWTVWGIFAFEYVVRFTLSPVKKHFVKRNWADLLIVLLPFLRPLRVTRSVRALRLFRLARLASILGVVGREGKRLLVRHQLHYSLLVILIVILGSASLVLVAEEGHGGSIDTFGDALWWAATTVTTVGYGDTFPITPAGRGIAVFLMVAGITLFGLLTANIATFLIERTEEPKEDEVMARLDELLRRMTELERRLPATQEN